MDAAVLAVLRAGPAGGQPAGDLLRATGMRSGRLYPALVRLERAGLITARWPASGRKLFAPSDAAGTVSPEDDAAVAARRYRPLWWVVAAVAIWTGFRALAPPAAYRLTDLLVYVGAVDGMAHGQSLYDFSRGNAPFTYPPFAGLVLWPLSTGPIGAVGVIWTLSTLALVIALAVGLQRRRWPAPALALVLLLSAPVSSNLKYGQVSLGIAALVLMDLAYLHRSRLQGVAIGIAAAVKLTPLIFVPLLWRAGRRRAAAAAVLTFGAAATVAAAVRPTDSVRFWATEMWRVSRLGYIDSVGNQSVNGALLRFGIDNPTRSLLSAVVIGGIVALALRRAVRAARGDDWLAAAIITGAAGVVASPVSWTHHQLWLVLAVLLPTARPWWPLTVLVVMLLPVTALGPPVFSNARLLLAIAIAIAAPFAAAVNGRTDAGSRHWAGPPPARRDRRRSTTTPGRGATA